VVFGLIIDTFSALRDEQSQVLDDTRNVCTICQVEKRLRQSFPSYTRLR
jgi:hypothetical protein